MKNITYKGYITTPKFSKEDNLFYGKIENIDDLVSFQSETEDELEDAFKEAVDDYLKNLVNYDTFDLETQENFINEKALRGWRLVSIVPFIDEVITKTKSTRMYFERKVK